MNRDITKPESREQIIKNLNKTIKYNINGILDCLDNNYALESEKFSDILEICEGIELSINNCKSIVWNEK